MVVVIVQDVQLSRPLRLTARTRKETQEQMNKTNLARKEGCGVSAAKCYLIYRIGAQKQKELPRSENHLNKGSHTKQDILYNSGEYNKQRQRALWSFALARDPELVQNICFVRLRSPYLPRLRFRVSPPLALNLTSIISHVPAIVKCLFVVKLRQSYDD